jgi:hypothetical protein
MGLLALLPIAIAKWRGKKAPVDPLKP